MSCACEQAANISGIDFLSIGRARGHTVVIFGEVRIGSKRWENAVRR